MKEEMVDESVEIISFCLTEQGLKKSYSYLLNDSCSIQSCHLRSNTSPESSMLGMIFV